MQPSGGSVVHQRHRLDVFHGVATCICGGPRDEQTSCAAGFGDGIQGPGQGDVRTRVFRQGGVQHKGGSALLGGRFGEHREPWRHGVEDRQGLGGFCLVAGFVGGDVGAGPHARAKTFPFTPHFGARPGGRAAGVCDLSLGRGKAVGAGEEDVLGDKRENRGRGVDHGQRLHQRRRVQTCVHGHVDEVQRPLVVHPHGVHRRGVGHVATAVLSGGDFLRPRCTTRQGPSQGGHAERR